MNATVNIETRNGGIIGDGQITNVESDKNVDVKYNLLDLNSVFNATNNYDKTQNLGNLIKPNNSSLGDDLTVEPLSRIKDAVKEESERNLATDTKLLLNTS